MNPILLTVTLLLLTLSAVLSAEEKSSTTYLRSRADETEATTTAFYTPDSDERELNVVIVIEEEEEDLYKHLDFGQAYDSTSTTRSAGEVCKFPNHSFTNCMTTSDCLSQESRLRPHKPCCLTYKNQFCVCGSSDQTSAKCLL
uniref:Uncharacterized protein n=1 Tax=Grammatophora oceanica TaxID=210454 RepID=A0A7S1UYR8_9STRA|mmetsp:Transcript_27169/g.39789  ORF Transcript_27169/g.39789 Transcript_27169/m.39789 type:complete len:143 (+) Transcript_27169:42-470(+)